MKAAKYSYTTAPDGYGGENGLNKPTCTSDYIPIGKLCLTYPVGAAMTFTKAKEECMKIGGKVYNPIDAVQDAIMASRLKEWVNMILCAR